MRTTLEGAWTRFEGAEATRDQLMVALEGSPVVTLPKGLERTGDDGADGLRPGESPELLAFTVGDVFEHFRRILDDDSPAFRATHLAHHARTFGISSLCHEHGLPLWHTKPARTRAGPELPRGAGVSCLGTALQQDGHHVAAVRVEHAVRMAEFFEALIEVADRVRRRVPVKGHLVETITVMKFLTAGPTFEAEVRRDGKLSSRRARQLVALAADSFLQQADVRPGVSWIAYKQPELVMKARDSWGALGLELARRLGNADARQEPYRCAECDRVVHLPRRPRPGDAVYCDNPECQRARVRRNKARQRAQRRGAPLSLDVQWPHAGRHAGQPERESGDAPGRAGQPT